MQPANDHNNDNNSFKLNLELGFNQQFNQQLSHNHNNHYNHHDRSHNFIDNYPSFYSHRWHAIISRLVVQVNQELPSTTKQYRGKQWSALHRLLWIGLSNT
jgi:hypothetical protein